MINRLFRLAYWVAILDLVVGMWVFITTRDLLQTIGWLVSSIICFVAYYWNEHKQQSAKKKDGGPEKK
jgi:hypothetical protein